MVNPMRIFLRNSTALLPALLLAACTTMPGDTSNPAGVAGGDAAVTASQAQPQEDRQSATQEDEGPAATATRFSDTPRPPYWERDNALPVTDDAIRNRLPNKKVGVNFYDIPIGRFINEVFGNVLGLSFELDDGLRNREDLVTVRASEDQSAFELYRMARDVLLNYGVGIEVFDTYLRFVPAQDSTSTAPPLFITGSALPDVPASHRTVFYFAQVKAVREAVIKGWIETAFKGTGLIVQSDPINNSIVLQGPQTLVSQAMETVRLLDRPNLRGRHSVRINPSFVDAPTLARMLTEVLESEGIGAVQKGPFGSVIVLPMAPTNSVIVFAADGEMLDHVKHWASELDQPLAQNGAGDFFYYQVRNTSAADLAEALSGVGSTRGSARGEEGQSVSSPDIYVDKNRNGLVFTGESKQWKSYLPIIKAMDRPARLVDVEVTVASVTLSDDTDLGIEWLFNGSHGRFDGVGQSNFGLGGTGFSYTLNNSGQVRFALNALSQDQRVTILSKPSILVKSGETASIDVGQEVPIITSQAQSTDATDTPVLQNITYRKTGVLLEVEPTVHSGNRVDLYINQEVSEVLDSAASSVDSPSIFNRQISTSLTLADGGAVILGGLISSSQNQGSSKVPLLGNIPGFGALFRSSGKQESRSELVLVIQAYIIDIEEKDWDFNEQLERKLNLLDAENLELNP